MVASEVRLPSFGTNRSKFRVFGNSILDILANAGLSLISHTLLKIIIIHKRMGGHRGNFYM